MSAEATGWVWRHSTFTGSQLLVHLAIADVVNDLHNYEFWMSTDSLAKKAKVSRSTVTTTLAEMVGKGYLDLITAGGQSRRPSRYRFTGLARYEDSLARSGASTSAPSARNTKDTNEQKEASAISGLVPDAACVRCHGSGEIPYGSGWGPCPCIDTRPVVEVQA